jgi:short-subunit dehydrogenase
MFRRAPQTHHEAALVTGASSGIGAALARALPASTSLVLVARDQPALEELAHELDGDGRTIDIVVADLGSEEGRRATIEAAEARAIDLLINNAGTGKFGRFLDLDEADDEATVQVNVIAPTQLSHALLPGMISRSRASGRRAGLINIASTAAFVPVPRLAVYAASKAFVLSFTEALAAELRSDPVDVLAVCPGPTRTSFGARAGFAVGRVPGARSPAVVAQQALASLGRRTVAFTDPPSELTLGPLVAMRRAVALGLKAGLDIMGRMQASPRRGRPEPSSAAGISGAGD